MKKIISFGLTALVLTILVSSCKKDNPVIPPEEQPQINLTLEDVSCTEAWIKLTTSNLSLPSSVELFKDSSFAQTINLTSADTILYVYSLLPNKTYIFISITQSIPSDPLQVTTMDTTSHNFTWQTWTFGGDAGSCNFYDVAIINENDIWAVGRVNIADTSINGYTTYNAVHWNGLEWELRRIKTNACGGVEYPPIKTIFAFSANDLLFAHIDGSISHYNGIEFTNDCSLITQLNGSANKMWGTSRNNFYVVSGHGFIAHYQNAQWTQMESGTDMTLMDIVGTSGNNIFICGTDAYNDEGIILKKDNSNWVTFVNSGIVTPQKLFNPDLYGSLPSIWIDEKNSLYAAGYFLFWYKFGKWDYVHSLPENFIGGNPGAYYRGYIGDVKGLKSNDMWIAGDRNTLRHFNGISWKQIGFPYSPDSDIAWYTVYPTETCVAVVGYEGNSAIVMLIKR